MESIPQLPKYTAPTGAYYVKPGMTREERLQDVAACGSDGGLRSEFTKEQVEEVEKAAKVTGEFYDIPNNNGYIILRKRWRACMESKGYHELPQSACEGDQEYQPRCMWP
jgi:hypothetical protein